jgi:hypothetical protein
MLWEIGLVLMVCVVTVYVKYHKDVIINSLVRDVVGVIGLLLQYDCVRQLLSMLSPTVDTQSRTKWIEFGPGSDRTFLPLPYNRRAKRRNIYLLYNDDRLRNINYPQGVSFYCTADEIGCREIHVEYEDVTKIYTGTESVE